MTTPQRRESFWKTMHVQSRLEAQRRGVQENLGVRFCSKAMSAEEVSSVLRRTVRSGLNLLRLPRGSRIRL